MYFTAEIKISGQVSGMRLFAPGELNISKFVKPGANEIAFRLISTRRNGFIGEAVRGNPFYAQFKGN